MSTTKYNKLAQTAASGNPKPTVRNTSLSTKHTFRVLFCLKFLKNNKFLNFSKILKCKNCLFCLPYNKFLLRIIMLFYGLCVLITLKRGGSKWTLSRSQHSFSTPVVKGLINSLSIFPYWFTYKYYTKLKKWLTRKVSRRIMKWMTLWKILNLFRYRIYSIFSQSCNLSTCVRKSFIF